MPTLVLCAIGDDATAREALRRGTKDYLVESHVDSHSFLRAKRNMVERETAADALFKETPACSSYSQFNRRDCSLHRHRGQAYVPESCCGLFKIIYLTRYENQKNKEEKKV